MRKEKPYADIYKKNGAILQAKNFNYVQCFKSIFRIFLVSQYNFRLLL